jgi:hypothetical protein
MKIRTLLMLLVMACWHSHSMALTPASFRVKLEAHFDKGAVALPNPQRNRLEELAEHVDDFSSAQIYVVAYGDGEQDDTASDQEDLIGRARANFVSTIFARRSDPSSEQIHTFTIPVKDSTQAGLVEIVISGVCREGFATCDAHWGLRAR